MVIVVLVATVAGYLLSSYFLFAVEAAEVTAAVDVAVIVVVDAITTVAVTLVAAKSKLLKNRWRFAIGFFVFNICLYVFILAICK